jgi:hypothetical protein
LESAFRRLRIQFLTAELELRKVTCESLARRFERYPLTCGQRADLLSRREDMLQESHLLEAMLDLLEREEREESEAGLRGLRERTQLDPEDFTCFTWFYRAKDGTH